MRFGRLQVWGLRLEARLAWLLALSNPTVLQCIHSNLRLNDRALAWTRGQLPICEFRRWNGGLSAKRRNAGARVSTLLWDVA